MRLDRHVRTLRSGIRRAYHYAIGEDGSRTALGSTDLDGSVSRRIYRQKNVTRIVAALQASKSLLVVGEAGCGKTVLAQAVAEQLRLLGFTVAEVQPRSLKESMVRLAREFGVDTSDLEGKALTANQLGEAIAEWLQDHTAFIVIDDAHRQTTQFRFWLEGLHKQGQPMLLLATFPPSKDIFLRLPRIELNPLPDWAIREIMQARATELGIELNDSQLAALQQRCGGNPMLAGRVVDEEYLGLEDLAPDHTQWIDGTPFLLASMMCLVVVRFLGLGFNSTSLYLLGGILTISVGVARILFMSIPRRQERLGK